LNAGLSWPLFPLSRPFARGWSRPGGRRASRRESRDARFAALVALARGGHLPRVLISQDSGWYHVGEPGGGRFRPYTCLFDGFLPAARGQAHRRSRANAARGQPGRPVWRYFLLL